MLRGRPSKQAETEKRKKRQETNQRYYQQGRIHGYPSRVRVGRGHNLGQWNIWAGAIRPKPPLTPKKTSVTDGRVAK